MNFSSLYTRAVSARALATAKRHAEAALLKSPGLETALDESLRSQFQALKSLPEQDRVVPGMAIVREAARRTLQKPHYLVQLQGGQLLLQRVVAEMRTGEGKTLTVTVAAALRALDGKGVHVVTANEYLAQRDAELMRPIYEMLGLTVGATLSTQSVAEKTKAYACDITYGVGSEFGFDYLKDNQVPDASMCVQRGQYTAIVDEVDSILIDEARVPLIISESAEDLTEMVQVIDSCLKQLSPEEHFRVNLKEMSAELTETGYLAAEQYLVQKGVFSAPQALYDANNLLWVRRLHSAVRAYALYRKNRDYVVTAGELVLVDPGTGRAMQGRRLDDGLHEALEAREGLPIKQGTVTRATITFQSYFALYQHLSGLSGTAATDADEFAELYNLKVVVLPPNRPVIRKENEDLVFLTRAEKFKAAVAMAAERSARGQPVLVGCASVRDAEVLDRLLTQAGVEHKTLTAKHIESEAQIIAQAGRPGSVTVATNMAGRGTDILLGGEPPEVQDFEDSTAFAEAKRAWQAEQDRAINAGGLFVLGTERNGLRRVDNQLAGRSGRQGNPGEVQFLLSLEDDLLKVFGQSKNLGFLRRLIESTGQAIGGKTVARLVDTAQRAVESQGFAARKNLLKFDSVLADQRNAVYGLRASLLSDQAKEHIQASAMSAVQAWVSENIQGSLPETWDAGALKKTLALEFGLDVPLLKWVTVEELDEEEIAARILAAAAERIEGLPLTEEQAKALMLEVLDKAWATHLTMLRELQDNSGLKAHTGQNVTSQFHKDAFELFKSFQAGLDLSVAERVMPEQALANRYAQQKARATERDSARKAEEAVAQALEQRWVGRNEACPCGSGHRFKDCHGKL